MIIVLLLVGLFAMFGGNGGEGLVKDIAKPVKQHVLDKTKATQIIEINKEMLEAEAAFAKDVAKAKKQLAKLNGDRLAPEGEFDAVFTALAKKRTDTREGIIDRRFKIKELMTAAEWNNVYAEECAPK